MMKMKTIVVPTDFSQNSLRALEKATDFAKRFDAEIVLLHVLEAPIYPAMTFGAGAANLPTIHQELRDTVDRNLRDVRDEHLPEGVAVRLVMREGNPYAEILDTAREEGADLIVIATHGHSGIKHLLLGSVTEKVVRKSPCPVLTVRSTAA